MKKKIIDQQGKKNLSNSEKNEDLGIGEEVNEDGFLNLWDLVKKNLEKLERFDFKQKFGETGEREAKRPDGFWSHNFIFFVQFFLI